VVPVATAVVIRAVIRAAIAAVAIHRIPVVVGLGVAVVS